MASVVPSSAPELRRAELALALAGRALDPNSVALGADSLIGSELLARALRMSAQALGAPASEPLCDAIAKLGDAVLVDAAGSRERAIEITNHIESAARGDALSRDLVEAELFTAKILEAAQKNRRLHRATRRYRFILLIAGIGALVAGLYLELHHGHRFKASSAFTGYHAEGELGTSQPNENFFHTTNELNPWVEIDLGSDRDISKITVQNRFDCCTDRAIPLIVSARTSAGEFHEIARRTAVFDKWTAVLPKKERARFVRLMVQKKTFFHLSDVDIR